MRQLFDVALGNATSRCVVVAEVGQGHDGSLGVAHSYVDAVATAGADAVKFQTHLAAAESTPDEPWRVKFSREDRTRYEYWKRMEFTEEQWRGLREHAEECGLSFLSSPFSVEAVELLERVGVVAWKVASGELTNVPLLDRMLESRLPLLLSTGMSTMSEIDRAVERVRARTVPCIILQATSAYPCPPQRVGLNVLGCFRDRYGLPVGLSDHSGTIYPALAAAGLGATLVEVHVTFSRQMFGPDVTSSVTIEELAELAKGVRYVHDALSHPVDKDALATELEPVRLAFTRSIVARHDLPAGTVLSGINITTKKPGTGIPAWRFNDVLGLRTRRPYRRDEPLQAADLAAGN